MTTSCTARTSMPRAVASVLMRLWGEELWALPWPGARTPHYHPLGTRQTPGASASLQSRAGSRSGTHS